MALDTDDAMVRLSQIGQQVPEIAHISYVSLHRWCRRGVRGHLLRSMMIGGVLYVKPSEVRLLLSKLNRVVRPSIAPRSTKRRNSQIRAAQRRADRAGVTV